MSSNPTLPHDQSTFPHALPAKATLKDMDKMDNKLSIEESTTEYTGHFPEVLPMRTDPPPATAASLRERLRRFYTLSLSSYSLIHTPDGAARMRHVAMITILLLRSAMSALSILSAVIKGSIWRIILYSLLALLGVWFTATCLAIIGDAEGDRKLGRIVIKRWHFDSFLGFCVVIHAGLIVTWFFGLSGWGLELTGIGMWLAILFVAWIAGWVPPVPELPKYQRAWAS